MRFQLSASGHGPSALGVRRQRWSICAMVLGLLISSMPHSAQAAKDNPTVGTSSRRAREEAAKQIPFDRMPEDLKAKIVDTVKNPSIFRRVPVEVIDCDPDLYLFLVRHPETVVNIWQVMGVSKVALTRTGAGAYRGSDGAGTTGDIRLCFSNHDTQVIYAEGGYEGPMFSRPLKARCVLVLRAGYVQETNGRHYITNRLDTFVHFDHMGVELAAKTFSPLVSKTIDVNFRETASFVSTISRTSESNPRGMQRLAYKLTTLEPAVREEFANLSGKVGQKAADRDTYAVNELPSDFTSIKQPGKKLRR